MYVLIDGSLYPFLGLITAHADVSDLKCGA